MSYMTTFVTSEVVQRGSYKKDSKYCKTLKNRDFLFRFVFMFTFFYVTLFDLIKKMQRTLLVLHQPLTISFSCKFMTSIHKTSKAIT